MDTEKLTDKTCAANKSDCGQKENIRNRTCWEKNILFDQPIENGVNLDFKIYKISPFYVGGG